MHVFDMESGFRRVAGYYKQQIKPSGSQKSSVLPYVTALDSSARSSSRSGIKSSPVSEFSKAEYIERMCILLTKNKTLVTAGSDGNMCFWDGIHFRLVLTISTRHAETFGLVDVQTDKSNHYLVSGDQGGFVNVWDIKEYRSINPCEEQVKKLSFWQAHKFAISAVDIVPYPRKGASESAALGSFKSSESFDYVVVTCSSDKKVLVWSSCAVLIGQLGQSPEWILDNMSTWESKQSMNSIGNDSVSLDRQEQIETVDSELENDDYEFLKTDEKPTTPKLPRLKSAKLEVVGQSVFLDS
jgi:WD40 repeat protein